VSPSVKPILAGNRIEPGAQDGIWLLTRRSTSTNELLVGALRERGVGAQLVDPAGAWETARGAHTVVGRLDVSPTVDGVEDGIWALRRVEARGTRVLNPASSLLACHDKLQTALRLAAAGVPHPATGHMDERGPRPALDFPLVLKPRFGSWGRDVVLCETHAELERRLQEFSRRPWFRRHGTLVQALVDPLGFDLRLVVARGRVVGAVERVAAPGDWRTNIALGGSRVPVTPPPEACCLALAAADAVGGDLVGVDLLPLPDGGYVVLEVNGAVEFTAEYSVGGHDVFEAVADQFCAEPRVELAAGEAI
jgi:RimK family alpha-L-glutamate ligase